MCDECMKKIINNISQNEILLLEFMNSKKMYNAQFSSDSLKLANSVKGMTKYKIDIALKRMELIGFIDSVKFGSIRYYLTQSGRKFIKKYKTFIMENTMDDENS